MPFIAHPLDKTHRIGVLVIVVRVQTVKRNRHGKGKVLTHSEIQLLFTKGQLGTRTIPIIADLRAFLVAYHPEAGNPYLFPGRYDLSGHINSDSAARVLRKACAKVGIEGVSTHSFRRTALTQLSDNNIPIRVIAAYSGHRDLAQLNAYLEVRDEQVLGAAASLSMLSPVMGDVGRVGLHDIPHNPQLNPPSEHV